MNTAIRFSCISVSLLLVASAASGVTFSHSGNTDPTTEGWILSLAVPSNPADQVTTGPVTNDLGTGINAWYIEDSSTELYTTGGYRQAISSDLVNDASTNGWALSTTVRIVERSTGVYPSPIVLYQNGETRYAMIFDLTENSDPIVYLQCDLPNELDTHYTLIGAGSASYHTYSLVFDPVAGSADFFVDGMERISDYGGMTLSSSGSVSWGAGSSNATGRAHFSDVTLEITPEPMSSGLLLGFLGLVGFRRRKK